MKSYKGKIISVLGDSISTFEGHVPVADGTNLTHRTRYPQDNLVTDVKKTWWMQVLNKTGATLGVNDSWAGSRICNLIEGNSGDEGEDAAMASLTRIRNLGANGTPALILFYGGTNDAGKMVPLGEFDERDAPAAPDLGARRWTDFSSAFCEAILRIVHLYPQSELIVMSPSFSRGYYPQERLDLFADRMMLICKHYGIPLIDLRECGITVDMLPDGLHPNADGMKCIAHAVLEQLLLA